MAWCDKNGSANGFSMRVFSVTQFLIRQRPRFVTTLVASGLTFLSTLVLAEEWSRFRGPDGSGVEHEKLPTTWDEQTNLAWKTPLPGRGSSSPVVFGDRVFLNGLYRVRTRRC